MKKLALLFVLVIVVAQVFGQKKKKQDEIDAEKIDSLTNVATALQIQLDSITKEKELYYGVYATIKEEIIKYDFDPSKTSVLIDSLRTSRDSTSAFLIDSSTILKDSLSLLILDNNQLKAKLDSMSIMPTDVNTDDMVKELKQLKELLDAKIINQEDFDAKKDLIMQKWR